MKHKALAFLIPTMLLTCAASAAEIYNKDGNKLDLHFKLDGLHYLSDDKSVDGDHSYTRFGFSGETQITDLLTGYGQWEYQANLNRAEGEDNHNFTRFGFAGLKFGDYGSLDYGRNSGIMYDIMAWTDLQPEFDGSTVGPDEFMFQRAGGVLSYHNRDFFGLVDGLNFGLQYQGKNDDQSEDQTGRDVLGQNGDGYGMSLSYDVGGGFSIGGAFFQSDRTNDQNGQGNYSDIMGRGDKAEAYTGGVKYQYEGFYAAANYTQSYNAIRFGTSHNSTLYGYANKAQSVEVYTGYTFDFGLQPFIGWNYVEGKDLGRSQAGGVISRDYGNQKLLNFIDLGTSYYFNKNMSAYVDYKINLLDDNDFTKAANVSTDDIVALGLVYQF